MKLTSIILVLYSILFVDLVYSNDEFNQLFDLKTNNSELLLANKQNIKLPNKNLTPLQRLHRYINTFGDLQLYISSYSNKLYIVPVCRLNLMYGSALSIKVLHEHNGEYVSLTYDDETIEAQKSYKEVTTEDEATKAHIDTNKKISIKDILTNNENVNHIVNLLEYGVFNSTNKIFLTELYSPEYSKDLLISFQHNQQDIRVLVSPYNSQLDRCYLLTKLLTSDLACYITSAYNLVLHKAKKQTNQSNDTK